MAPGARVLGELFELELFGEGIERRYRRLRPEVEAMPWGTLSVEGHAPHVVVAARRAWTGAAFQEHRTGAACALTLKALIEVRAPLDLIAIACRFPLDEMVHVELCSRLAMELGGGTELRYDPLALIYEPSRELSPLRICSELVVHNFCVGEALSIPMLRGAARAANQPLTRAVLSRIVRDEAMHGSFGWSYLEWARDQLTPEDLQALSRLTARSIRGVLANWEYLRRELMEGPSQRPKAHELGWMQTRDYLTLAAMSIDKKVLAPLARFGIDPRPYLEGELEALVPPAGAMPNADAAAE
ncbi:MAG TPA: ferritin-like domain-containing protein [Polyangiales bacterium]